MGCGRQHALWLPFHAARVFQFDIEEAPFILQGAIYLLSDPDGKDCGKLLKTLKFKAALPITGNDIGRF